METRNKIKILCESKGVPASRVEKELGFSNGSLLRPKSYKSDKLIKIANYFGVDPKSLLDDEKTDFTPQYFSYSKPINLEGGIFIDADALEYSELVHKRPELKVLFKSGSGVSEENLKFVIDLLDRLKQLEAKGEL